MKIRLLKRMANPLGNHPAGRILTVPDSTGEALVHSGAAEPLEKPETRELEKSIGRKRKAGNPAKDDEKTGEA